MADGFSSRTAKTTITNNNRIIEQALPGWSESEIRLLVVALFYFRGILPRISLRCIRATFIRIGFALAPIADGWDLNHRMTAQGRFQK